MQVDDHAASGEILAVFGVQHGAAAGREDDPLLGDQFLDDLTLAGAKAGFAFELEDGGDVDTRSALDLVVAVLEGIGQRLGQLASDGTLAGAHRADDEDILCT